MTKSGQYLLTVVLTIMLVIAPMRAVLALPMDSGEPCASMSMSDQGSDLQQGQLSTAPDTEHSNQAHGCCSDMDSDCASDCQISASQSYIPVSTSLAKTPRQHFLNNGFKNSTVPIGNLTPLLRPPATLHG